MSKVVVPSCHNMPIKEYKYQYCFLCYEPTKHYCCERYIQYINQLDKEEKEKLTGERIDG